MSLFTSVYGIQMPWPDGLIFVKTGLSYLASFGGSYDCVTYLTCPDRVYSVSCKILDSRDIETWQHQFIQSYCDFGDEKTRAYLIGQVEQRASVLLGCQYL